MDDDKWQGVQLLVQLLGGQWGKVNLEKKYDIVERALFRCLQKQDESNDSFLARCDVVWSELLAKKVQLEEIQSYIVLRGSRLSTEDKKRVIVESESSSRGVLNMEKVTQSVRMLGTSFFNEMIGQKASKGKIYESQVMLTEDQDDFQHDESADVADECTEDEFVGQLLQDDDEDAALIADYESRAADVLQGDSDLAATYNAYADARRKLSDRFKHRGFWPVGQGKGSGKSSASKGKGKYFNKVSKKSLQQRILESHCRLCGRKGHWRAECPDRTRSNASTGSTNTSAAMTVSAVSQPMEESNALPMEFMQLPMVHEETLDVPSWQEIHVVVSSMEEIRDRLRKLGKRGKGEDNQNPNESLPRNERITEQPESRFVASVREQPAVAYFSTYGTCGILDTGASKSVMGSKLLPALLEGLPVEMRQQVFRTSCDITFRFGNQGTLDSQHALVIPLKSVGLGLKIAIVPGETPLLLSNTLLRTLKASLNSEHHTLSSPLLNQVVKLKLSPRGLYMLDLIDLLRAQKDLQGPRDAIMAETFMSSDFSSENQQAETCQPSLSESQGNSLKSLSTPTGPGTQGHVHMTSRSQGSECSFECTEISRPKPPSTEFLHLVAKVNNCDNHEPTSYLLWSHSRRENICRGVGSGEVMDEMVRQDSRQQHQARAPESTGLSGKGVGLVRGEPWHGASEESRRSARGDVASIQMHVQEQGHAGTSSACGGDPGDCGSQRPVGCHGLHSTATGPDQRDDRGTPSSSTEHGRCHQRDLRTSPSGEVNHALWMLCQAGDIDAEFENHPTAEAHFSTNTPNHLHYKFHKLVQPFTRESKSISQSCSQKGTPIQVLEVFCGPQSELTKQVNNLGYKGVRHGFQEGDLATESGRAVLFTKLIEGQPRSLWYSPTCSPWCAWSAMNAAQTEAGFKTIQALREQHMYQLALGIVLFRFQRQNGRHMHWEQPARSLMTRSPMLREVMENTYLAQFDMCRVGGMRDPVNQLLYKKGMEILTTSYQLYSQLHGRKCNHLHQHQTLEGETMFKGHRMRRTEFSENYTRKFARTLAQVLTKVKMIKEAPLHVAEHEPSFASSGAKRRSVSAGVQSANRAKLKEGSIKSVLINPEMLPSKRRRLSGKTQSDDTPKVLCEQVFNRVLEIMPKVGRKEINDPQVKSMLQENVWG